jgi:hypothetical protein
MKKTILQTIIVQCPPQKLLALSLLFTNSHNKQCGEHFGQLAALSHKANAPPAAFLGGFPTARLCIFVIITVGSPTPHQSSL